MHAHTLADHFRDNFAAQPDQEIFRFLGDGDEGPVGLTNRDVDRRARAVAATLQERCAPGDRALIVCPPGLDYVSAFLACLYAGVIAVPVYPLDPAFLKRTLTRLVGIVEDAEPVAVLAPSSIIQLSDQFSEHVPSLGALAWLAVDAPERDTAPDDWRRPSVSADDIAFLQYTSGSTSRPKGVMVRNSNLIHNLEHINGIWGDPPEGGTHHMVTWLPPYHDMGLIAGVLAPAFGSYPVTIMSPFSFLKRPLRWLRAVAELGGTVSGGPNFAYDLCVSKTTESERAALDLSGWRVAFSGAEPVRLGSLRRFTDAFAVSGLRSTALMPAYGLAEGTLLVSSQDWATEATARQVQAEALEHNQVRDPGPGDSTRTVVGSGRSIVDQEVAIVDPESRVRLPDGVVGEVWVCGPSVAAGYWRRPELSEEIFRARTDTGHGPFLRTGDLGFLLDGELHVTGRLKDVIIVAGKNHYPQDIELAVEQVDPVLQPHAGVACTEEAGDGERLVLIQEVVGRPAADVSRRIISAIRATVAEEFGLQAHTVALIGRGQVPKTSSGKLQRAACLQAFREGRLRTLMVWNHDAEGPEPAESPAPAEVPSAATASPDAPVPSADGPARADLEDWLTERLAERLDIPAARIDRAGTFASYGLRSVDAVGLIGDLEQHLGRELSPTLVWAHPTIEALAGELGADGREATGTGTAPAAAPAGRAAPSAGEPVAIVGIGCRFPGGVTGPESFWKLLSEGMDAVSEVPADRWKTDDHFHEDPAVPGRTNSRWGGFLDDIDRFDPQFFGISQQEAARMDPQQRVLAEVAREALDDAGIPVETLAGSPAGVFVGISSFDYANLQLTDLPAINAYVGTGSALSIAANRLSYLFDLRGPSMAVDTACSSSLVAVHQALTALERGDCDLALAGGVNVILSPAAAINFSKAGVMAPDGRCKAFDARADGYVRSEGAGVVVLRPLSKALAAGDRIYGVINGGAVNQDGRSNGLMAPNPQAQEAVLRAAYTDAGVRPADVTYVEAHGTGTNLGDPIEVKALAAVVGEGREPGRPCLIGSVKSNLGHMEAAAGVGGLIKTALMLHHGEIPASLHFDKPNPLIPFDTLPVEVVARRRALPTTDGPALAGVSSFGFGGTNAHLVLSEAPKPADDSRPADSGPWALTLSARTPEALRELAARWETRLAGPDAEAGARTLAYTAAVRRSHHEHRLVCVGESPEDFRERLAAFREQRDTPGLVTRRRGVGRRPKAAFVFPGQGPRWWPLAADLLAHEPVFRATIEECAALLGPDTDWSLTEQLAAAPESSRLRDPEVGQPALCAVQVALAALWRSWGVEPAAVVGHSVGEIAAAHVAGALSLPDALRIALRRGEAIRAAGGSGRMAMVGLSYERAQALLTQRRIDQVWVAAGNGPAGAVFSGEGAAVHELARTLEAEGVFCRVLESVDFASHSPLMAPIAAELAKALDGLTPGDSALPMVSTVTAEPIPGTLLDASYWADNLSRPVLFDRAVRTLADTGHDVFVEMSPHAMLHETVADRLDEEGVGGAVAASLRRDEPGRATLLAELGRLYCEGYPVDWCRLFEGAAPVVSLPSYPWQRQRCWIEERPERPGGPAHTGHPALQDHVRSAVEPLSWYWSGTVDLLHFPYLRDHVVDGVEALPAAFVLDSVLAAVRDVVGDERAVLEGVELHRLTRVAERSGQTTFQLVCTPETGDTGSFRFLSRADESAGDTWAEAATGRYRVPAEATGTTDPTEPLGALRERCRTQVDPGQHYATLDAAGLRYGPAFQGVAGLWRGTGEALAELTPPTGPSAADAYLVHPALIDSALQTLNAARDADPERTPPTYVPVGVGRFRLFATGVRPAWAYAQLPPTAADADTVSGGRVVLMDAQGTPVGEVLGITLRRLGEAPDPVAESLLDIVWRQAPAGAETAGDTRPGRWLLFADRGGACAEVRAEAEARGGTCVTVTEGSTFARTGGDSFTVRPGAPEDYRALLTELRGSGDPFTTVVDARPLDDGDDTGPAALWTGGAATLRLVQALVDAAPEPAPKLLLLTRGAQRVAGDTEPVRAAQAGVWGFARVLRMEHAELRPVVVDLDPAGGVSGLLDEALRGGTDDQVALRGGRRHTPRLVPWRAPARSTPAWRERDAGTAPNHRLLATSPGTLDSLRPTWWERREPGHGEIEIQVTAAGLNFNDVLKALDICPGVPSGSVPLGGECAGRVTAVGAGVDRFRPGDAVIAVAPSSMARYTTTHANLAAPLPPGLADHEGAALPIAFLTAVYGLEYLGRLGAGETVLIHSASGGVGLAALQVARRCGAEVIATAGSEAKRELLRGLGVTHVLDSRSLRFADEVRELTGGRGVDVVLNSLAGEALTRSVELLAPGGRFVEIGKQDVYANSHLGLGTLAHNRFFFAVDLEYSFQHQQAMVARLLDEVLLGFERGHFSALPTTAFPYAEAADAFARMARAQHTGKIVLHPDATPPATVADRPAGTVRADATYLITGGLGALGLETARYLAGQGARHLALVGRNGPSAQAATVLEELRAQDVDVRICRADVARADDVTAVLDELHATLPPLAGIVHAAGTLQDGLLVNLDEDALRSVAEPKALGAWHLHRETERYGLELDFFVLYSSAAALLGSAGQANYAAANAYLDALAQYRTARGLPAQSVNWGPWAEAGLAARPDRGGALATRGVVSLRPKDGIEALHRLLGTGSAQACVLPLDRQALRAAAAGGLLPPMLTSLAGADTDTVAADPRGGSEVRDRMLGVEPGRRRRTILTEHCRAQAAQVLGIGTDGIAVTSPLTHMGFDSLLSLELRKRLENTLQVQLPATLAWRYPTVEALVPFLADRMGVPLEAEHPAEPPAGTPAPAADDDAADGDDAVDDLSEDELVALLLAKTQQIDEGA